MTLRKDLKLTSRGRYAVMALVDLASQSHPETSFIRPVPLAEIAARGRISLSYLEQLFAAMRQHGLVKSYRGPGGGYLLARKPDEIVISEILLAAEDSAPAKRTLSGAESPASGISPQTDYLWFQIAQFLHGHLQRITLQDVIDGQIGTLAAE